MTGLLGKKLGMTQVFAEDGTLISVTAIEAGPCLVLQIKDKAIQIGFEPVKETKVNKPRAGFFKKIKVSPQKFIREVSKQPDKEYKISEELKVDCFRVGEFVDVVGISIGKGFQGGMKRWHWHGGPRTHGSTSKRRVGSIGSSAAPSRVWKGQHLPGHMGNRRLTTQNLKVVKIDLDNNLILVKGSVPGSKNSYLIIKKSLKKPFKIESVKEGETAPKEGPGKAKIAAKKKKK